MSSSSRAITSSSSSAMTYKLEVEVKEKESEVKVRQEKLERLASDPSTSDRGFKVAEKALEDAKEAWRDARKRLAKAEDHQRKLELRAPAPSAPAQAAWLLVKRTKKRKAPIYTQDWEQSMIEANDSTLKTALKLNKKHKVVDLTNGAIINHRVTTKACASVSKQGVAVATNDAQLALARPKGGTNSQRSRTSRRNGMFSDGVRTRDDFQCVVCETPDHGEAAHLIDLKADVPREHRWSKDNDYGIDSLNDTINGILLCHDCHTGTLGFDRGMWTFDEKGHVFVSKAVRMNFKDKNKLKHLIKDSMLKRLWKKAQKLIKLHGQRLKTKRPIPKGVFKYRWIYFKTRQEERHKIAAKNGYCAGCGKTFRAKKHECNQTLVLRTPKNDWEDEVDSSESEEQDSEDDNESLQNKIVKKAMNKKKLSRWNVPQLQSYLKQHSLNATGRKAVLVSRILKHSRSK